MYHLTMTPAERASAVAFALKNCALEAMTPGDATMRAAAGYERGDNDVSALIDTAPRTGETSGIVSGRLADRSLDDHATDHASACSPEQCCWLNAVGIERRHCRAHRHPPRDCSTRRVLRRRTAAPRTSPLRGHRQAASGQTPRAFFPAQLIETGALRTSRPKARRQTQPGQPRPGACSSGKLAHVELLPAPVQGGNAMTLRIFASRLAHSAGWDRLRGDASHTSRRNTPHIEVTSTPSARCSPTSCATRTPWVF